MDKLIKSYTKILNELKVTEYMGNRFKKLYNYCINEQKLHKKRFYITQ